MRKTFLLTVILGVSIAAGAQKYKFNNTRLSDSKRIDCLIDMLTLDEKISLLSTNLGVERLGIPDCGQREGLHGVAIGGPGNWGIRKRDGNGVPYQTEYPTTIFPQSYGLGESWDTGLMAEIGNQMAEELRWYAQSPKSECGCNLVLRAPNADLGRDPRWGRTEECFGEDAFLTASMTVAIIKGLQGDNPRYWKAAALMKHFLANSNEDGRDSTSSNFSERLFREYYSYPFYKGIASGGSKAFMAAYNSWNGVPMCVNPVLENIARREWGMDGIICTDGGALGLLINAHHAYNDRAEGAAAVVKATTGQFLDSYKEDVRMALERGILTEKDIDKAIRGNLTVALRLGLLDGEDSSNPYIIIGKDTTAIPPFLTKEACSLARKAVVKSAVLMKNEGSHPLLPIDTIATKRILLVGPYSEHVVQDWYSGKPPYEVSIAKGLKDAMRGTGVTINTVADNAMGRAETMAKDADMVIVCTGNHPYGTRTDWKFCPVASDGREAVDRHSMELPDEDMIRRLYNANHNMVLVLVSSFPYTINWCKENIPSILHTTHCSQEQGNGIADILLGKANPAGRLTQTWISDIASLPPMMDYDITNNRTYMYNDSSVTYPFGHGLSYTHFNYGRIEDIKVGKDSIHITVPVTNDGSMDGDEVVQVYAKFHSSKVDRPKQLLCAFSRISIDKGKTVKVRLSISKERLSYWDCQTHSFVFENCGIELNVGASSTDIRQTAFVP
ncbi:MAG: glycoside hydrolase family 3 C-terminal domain-containing protein [Prevotella sp.]|nr:glycoside hydrolase family 3 C-terminal domain-containing protein [Prevotella sp.]